MKVKNYSVISQRLNELKSRDIDWPRVEVLVETLTAHLKTLSLVELRREIDTLEFMDVCSRFIIGEELEERKIL